MVFLFSLKGRLANIVIYMFVLFTFCLCRNFKALDHIYAKTLKFPGQNTTGLSLISIELIEAMSREVINSKNFMIRSHSVINQTFLLSNQVLRL